MSACVNFTYFMSVHCYHIFTRVGNLLNEDKSGELAGKNHGGFMLICGSGWENGFT